MNLGSIGWWKRKYRNFELKFKIDRSYIIKYRNLIQIIKVLVKILEELPFKSEEYQMPNISKEEIENIIQNLPIRNRPFISGNFIEASSSKTFTSINPATGEIITDVVDCNQADIDQAVASCRKTFEDGRWSRSSPEHRKEVLLKLADLVRSKAKILAVLESIDSGKTITDCLTEVGEEVPNFFQWYAELSDKVFGKVSATGEDALALIVKEPAGVVGLILPWNFPLLMAAWKVAPALAAGCSVIVKPAEQTPLTCLYLAELAAEAGVPEGVFNVTPGLGETAGEAIGRHKDIDVVSFTGSTEVGGYFMKYSGESNLKNIGLEMGGKSPFIVLDDAVIDDDLIENAAMSAFWNGGENCSANMRQLVDASLVDEYIIRIITRAKQFKVGDPLDPETDIGAMITLEHHNRVMSYIQKGREEGAKLVYGGEQFGSPGLFIEPTIFTNVNSSMTISQEEIFGPVLGVLPVKGVEEALSIAKDTEFGLHASVFTRDIDRAIHMARRLPCGTVSVNGFSEGDVKTPFGGYKRSGSFARDNGVEALEQYVQTKTIWVTVNEFK